MVLAVLLLLALVVTSGAPAVQAQAGTGILCVAPTGGAVETVAFVRQPQVMYNLT